LTEEQDYTAIDALIQRLETAPRIDHMALWEQAKKERRANFERMFDEGLTWGGAMGAHPILNQSEDSFRIELQSIKQNLDAQIDVFNHGLDEYFRTGDYPPPYYPMRIAIILRKQNQKERERRFLSAYCNHFVQTATSRIANEFVDRAIKAGVVIPDWA
jgi:hypothetical protein